LTGVFPRIIKVSRVKKSGFSGDYWLVPGELGLFPQKTEFFLKKSSSDPGLIFLENSSSCLQYPA
jgi:hypothetical protein